MLHLLDRLTERHGQLQCARTVVLQQMKRHPGCRFGTDTRQAPQGHGQRIEGMGVSHGVS
jgi:hypothetical protein